MAMVSSIDTEMERKAPYTKLKQYVKQTYLFFAIMNYEMKIAQGSLSPFCFYQILLKICARSAAWKRDSLLSALSIAKCRKESYRSGVRIPAGALLSKTKIKIEY